MVRGDCSRNMSVRKAVPAWEETGNQGVSAPHIKDTKMTSPPHPAPAKASPAPASTFTRQTEVKDTNGYTHDNPKLPQSDSPPTRLKAELESNHAVVAVIGNPQSVDSRVVICVTEHFQVIGEMTIGPSSALPNTQPTLSRRGTSFVVQAMYLNMEVLPPDVLKSATQKARVAAEKFIGRKFERRSQQEQLQHHHHGSQQQEGNEAQPSGSGRVPPDLTSSPDDCH